VTTLSKLESKRLEGKTNQAVEETEVQAAWYVLQPKMGNRTEGRPDWMMVKPQTEREQRQEETQTIVLRSKSNRTQKRRISHMSNKNRFFIEK
jgi:hypothetical protein